MKRKKKSKTSHSVYLKSKKILPTFFSSIRFISISLAAILLLSCIGILLFKPFSSMSVLGTSTSIGGCPPGKSDVPPSDQFVTRVGNTLCLAGKPFKFYGGVGMYWLGLEGWTGASDKQKTYPANWWVDQQLSLAATQMHANVVSGYSLGATAGCTNCIEPKIGNPVKHIQSVFNDASKDYTYGTPTDTADLKHVAYVLYQARLHGLKVIIPFVDNWGNYDGTFSLYTQACGDSSPADFYTDWKCAIPDFEEHISKILYYPDPFNKDKNGKPLPLMDNPAILAWETGNELSTLTGTDDNGWGPAEVSWTEGIAHYIKNRDHNHLVIDGHVSGFWGRGTFDSGQLTLEPHIDILSTHIYPLGNKETSAGENLNLDNVNINAKLARQANKAYFVGEYGEPYWTAHNTNETLNLVHFLNNIILNGNISGDIFWNASENNNGTGEYAINLDPKWQHPQQHSYVQLLIQHAQGIKIKL